MDTTIRDTAAGRPQTLPKFDYHPPAGPCRDCGSTTSSIVRFGEKLFFLCPPCGHSRRSVSQGSMIEGCAEHRLPLFDGRCPECRDANGNPFVLNMQSKVLLPNPAESTIESVTICAWCPHLHILKMQCREQDIIIVYRQGKELRILRNGVNLVISHGICQPCRARMK
jgi:hypothetical protein